MQHDIKAINAAIRLGDFVIPPVGAHIETWKVRGEGVLHGTVVGRLGESWLYVELDEDDRRRLQVYECSILVLDVYESEYNITSVPSSNTTPFEKWERIR